MEYELITLDIDKGVLARIKKAADEQGLKVDEVIRMVLGQNFREYTPTLLTAIPQSVRAVPSDVEHFYAKMMAGSGQIKCRNCTHVFNSEDIMKGECPECGEKL